MRSNWKSRFKDYILERGYSYYCNEYKEEWVRILKRISTFKGGTDKVNKIVAEWKVKYKNRPALMDELEKLY